MHNSKECQNDRKMPSIRRFRASQQYAQRHRPSTSTNRTTAHRNGLNPLHAQTGRVDRSQGAATLRPTVPILEPAISDRPLFTALNPMGTTTRGRGFSEGSCGLLTKEKAAFAGQPLSLARVWDTQCPCPSYPLHIVMPRADPKCRPSRPHHLRFTNESDIQCDIWDVRFAPKADIVNLSR